MKIRKKDSPPNPLPLHQPRDLPRDILRTIPMSFQSLSSIKARITRHKQHVVAADRVGFQLEEGLAEVAVDVFGDDGGSGTGEVVARVGH